MSYEIDVHDRTHSIQGRVLDLPLASALQVPIRVARGHSLTADREGITPRVAWQKSRDRRTRSAVRMSAREVALERRFAGHNRSVRVGAQTSRKRTPDADVPLQRGNLSGSRRRFEALRVLKKRQRIQNVRCDKIYAGQSLVNSDRVVPAGPSLVQPLDKESDLVNPVTYAAPL
jgi:hypothetical protein